MNVCRKSRGFTLIELMITVAILAILSAVAYPAYTSQIAKGKRAECRSGLLQVMQQQERVFSQTNQYLAVDRTSTTAQVRNFSGNTRAGSACLIESTNCTAPGNTALTGCVEAQAYPAVPDSSITHIYLDSDSRRGCLVSGTRSTTNKTCWP